MTRRKQLDITNHKIWKDKNINLEAKEIYAYLYSQGFDKIVSHIIIGDIQQIISISNVGLRNNMKLLEKFNYIVYREYDKGLYEYHIY